jgi:hypothetical protein
MSTSEPVDTLSHPTIQYINHAKEVNMALPEVPVLFL